MRSGPPALLAVLVAATGVLAGACRTADRGPDRGAARADPGREDPRERCRRAFATCAPPAPFRPNTNVATLDVRSLVHLASRIDVGNLSGRAAKRLQKLAREGDEAAILEIEAALEDSDAVLGKCACKESPPELERSGVREIVRTRAPSRLMRSPATWTEWIVTRLANIRDLARLCATEAAGGDARAVARTQAAIHVAEKDLCEAVHGAREMLAAEAFEKMLEAVYLRRDVEAGAGSAEAARRTVGAYAQAASCEAPPPAN